MHQKHTRIVPVQQISCTIVQDVLCKKGEEKIAIFLIYFEPVVLDFHADLVKIYTFFLTSNTSSAIISPSSKAAPPLL